MRPVCFATAAVESLRHSSSSHASQRSPAAGGRVPRRLCDSGGLLRWPWSLSGPVVLARQRWEAAFAEGGLSAQAAFAPARDAQCSPPFAHEPRGHSSPVHNGAGRFPEDGFHKRAIEHWGLAPSHHSNGAGNWRVSEPDNPYSTPRFTLSRRTGTWAWGTDRKGACTDRRLACLDSDSESSTLEHDERYNLYGIPMRKFMVTTKGEKRRRRIENLPEQGVFGEVEDSASATRDL